MKLGCQTHFDNNTYPLTPLASGFTIPQLLSQLGVDFVRDECHWSFVETTKGTYTFPAQYAYFGDLAALGIPVLFTADSVNKFYDGGKTPFSPDGIAGFTNYVKAVLAQFPQLQTGTIEIYNEPDSSVFGTGPFYFAPARSYTALAIAVSKAIKALYPSIHILGGATSTQSVPFLRECEAWGIATHIDGWSFHYIEDEVVEQFAPFVASVARHSVSLTEFGAGAANPDLLVRTSVLALASNRVEYLSWYQAFGDASAWITSGGTFTPLGNAFKQIKSLIAPGLVTRIHWGNDASVYHYRFLGGDVFWGRYGQAVQINGGQCYDSIGSPISAPTALTFSPVVCIGGTVTITPRNHVDNSRIGFGGPAWSYWSNTKPATRLQTMPYRGPIFAECLGDPINTGYLQIANYTGFEPYNVGIIAAWNAPQTYSQLVARGHLTPNPASAGFSLTIMHNGVAVQTYAIPASGGEFDFETTISTLAKSDSVEFLIDCPAGYAFGNCQFEVELSTT